MEAVRTSETSGYYNETIRRIILEGYLFILAAVTSSNLYISLLLRKYTVLYPHTRGRENLNLANRIEMHICISVIDRRKALTLIHVTMTCVHR
jgi:hypothetical protein